MWLFEWFLMPEAELTWINYLQQFFSVLLLSTLITVVAFRNVLGEKK